MFLATTAANAHAWEVRLCDNNPTPCGGCTKEYSGASLQIDLADLNAVPWGNCPGVNIGPNLARIERSVPSWKADLFALPSYDGDVRSVRYRAADWPVRIPVGTVASLSLMGPAVRFCSDETCSRWTDILDLEGATADAESLTNIDGSGVPGRVARANLAVGGSCPSKCMWEYPTPGRTMNNDIERITVRSGLFRVGFCRGLSFSGGCSDGYQNGPIDLLLGADWRNTITSFDVLRNSPNYANIAHWGVGTCGDFGGFMSLAPTGPSRCGTVEECPSPYSCTTDRRCRLAACFDYSYTPSGSGVRVYYGEHISKRLIGVNFVTDYAEAYSPDIAIRAHDLMVHAQNFVKGAGGYAAPAGHAYPNMRPSVDVLLWTHGPGGSSGGESFNFGIWEIAMRSNRPVPFPRYLDGLGIVLHEYFHMVEWWHYLDQRMGFGTDKGISEGMANMFGMSMLADNGANYDNILVSWPYQEYCRIDSGTVPEGCVWGPKYSDVPVYNSFVNEYESSAVWAYLGSQFMTPEAGTAINPDGYVYSVGGVDLFKPLRYHNFWRQVADDLYRTPNPAGSPSRKAWITRMMNQALAGSDGATGAPPWKRCLDDDPTACALGAPATDFEDSSSFDHAFRRWARTHVEWYTAAERSGMDAKFELGGRSRLYLPTLPAGNDQPRFIELPFDLGPTNTSFTVIITAQTTRYGAARRRRDGLRVYIDSDGSGNRPLGRLYDESYLDSEQCYAFGHDLPGPTGCRYNIGGEWDTDGNRDDQRATMRFIPSTVFDNFRVAGGRGVHTLYIAARNDPIVYSVEIVAGNITPNKRPLALRGYYCDTRGGVCQFDDPDDSVSLGRYALDTKVVQVVAQATRDGEVPFENDGNVKAPEGIRIRALGPIGDEWFVGNETKFGAFHGWPMLGNPCLLRVEKPLWGSRTVFVDTHVRPFYHHAVIWSRPAHTFAARYYPRYRGLNMFGFAVPPRPGSSVYGVRTDTPGGTTKFNTVTFCETEGSWSKIHEFEMPLPGNTNVVPEQPCDRVYWLAGIAGPASDDGGTVLEVTFDAH